MRNLLTTFALLSVAACSANAADGAASSSADDTTTSEPTLSTIKGREWARCWFDVVGANAQLSCKSTARGTDPLGATVEAFGTSTGNGNFQTFSKTLDIENGGTVVVASVALTAFPVILSVTAKLDATAQHAIGLTNNTDFELDVTLKAPQDLSSAKPGIVGESFDLWPVVVIDASNATGAIGLRANYEHTIAPYTDFLDQTAMKLSPAFSFDKKVQYLVAPASGPLAMNATVADKSFTTSLPGAGYFALTQDGLRAATPAELGDTSTVTPTPAPAPAPTPDPTPAPTVDTDPTCGGDGQSLCQATMTCDDGTAYAQGYGTCHTCGADGQGACYVDSKNVDSSKGLRCNAGTAYAQGYGKCQACGGDGQGACYVDSNNAESSKGLKCNDGTAYAQGYGECRACGANGDGACFVDSNNADSSKGLKCNAGLTPSYNGYCVSQ